MQAREHNRTNILKEMKKIYIKPTVKILHIDFEGMMDTISGTAVSEYNGEASDISGSIGVKSGDDKESGTVYHTKGIDLWDDDDGIGR